MPTHTQQFETYRPMLFSIAYRMVSSVMDAEDILQEAFIRYQATPLDAIQSHKAFLSTIVTRLSLNHLQSARVQREQYIGPWLPEPLITDTVPQDNPAQAAALHESVSMAFLVLLESLSPLERAVFLLREVFDYGYDDIARILEKDEAACRQLFSRARKHIQDNRPRFTASPDEHAQIVFSFLQAVGDGNVDRLTQLLAENATVISDGGGKRIAARRPIEGREKVIKFFLGLQRNAPDDIQYSMEQVNGRLALVLRDAAQTPLYVITAQTADGHIEAFHVVANPDKLTHFMGH